MRIELAMLMAHLLHCSLVWKWSEPQPGVNRSLERHQNRIKQVDVLRGVTIVDERVQFNYLQKERFKR